MEHNISFIYKHTKIVKCQISLNRESLNGTFINNYNILQCFVKKIYPESKLQCTIKTNKNILPECFQCYLMNTPYAIFLYIISAIIEAFVIYQGARCSILKCRRWCLRCKSHVKRLVCCLGRTARQVEGISDIATHEIRLVQSLGWRSNYSKLKVMRCCIAMVVCGWVLSWISINFRVRMLVIYSGLHDSPINWALYI